MTVAVLPQFDALMARLRGRLVVSCQAPAGSPLRTPSAIAAMAEAAVLRGAAGVRLDSPEHVAAARSQTDAPIVGLWKREFPDSSVYITPQFDQARAVAEAGADLVATDATLRPRPGGESLADLIPRIRTTLGKPVMADVDTLAAGLAAAEAGADLVGTTLFGYTETTRDRRPPGFDLLAELVRCCPVPVVCEGGIASPEMARRALDLGAAFVVVGTAITGIDALTAAYCAALAASPEEP